MRIGSIISGIGRGFQKREGGFVCFLKERFCSPDEYQRTKSLLADHQIEYTTRSNPVTNPGRYHGVPSINASAAYEYHVYVAGKDYDRAMRILQGEN